MEKQNIDKIHRMWQSICPTKFQEIAPFTLFTTRSPQPRPRQSLYWNYPILDIHKNPNIKNFREIAREGSTMKKRIPVPCKRFSTIEKIDYSKGISHPQQKYDEEYFNLVIDYLGSMIASREKIIYAKQTPPIPKHFDGIMTNSSNIILLSNKGSLFIFGNEEGIGYSYNYSSGCFNDRSPPISKNETMKIDIYSLRYNNISLKNSFINNVLNVFLDHMMYDTPDSKYIKVHTGGFNCYSHYDFPQFRFDEDILDTLIVLVYAHLHSVDQQSIQKQSTVKSVPAQQQSYFQKQEKRMLKQVQSIKQQEQKRIRSIQASLNKKASELEKRQRSIRQKQLVELPEYLTDVAGDLSIMNDPVIASDGFTYSRRTAENIVRNRLNGRAGSRIRIIGPNHDMRKSINQFITKYEQVQDGKYRKK